MRLLSMGRSVQTTSFLSGLEALFLQRHSLALDLIQRIQTPLEALHSLVKCLLMLSGFS